MGPKGCGKLNLAAFSASDGTFQRSCGSPRRICPMERWWEHTSYRSCYLANGGSQRSLSVLKEPYWFWVGIMRTGQNGEKQGSYKPREGQPPIFRRKSRSYTITGLEWPGFLWFYRGFLGFSGIEAPWASASWGKESHGSRVWTGVLGSALQEMGWFLCHFLLLGPDVSAAGEYGQGKEDNSRS